MAYDWNFFINLYTRYYKVYDLSQLNLPLSEVIGMGLEKALLKLQCSLKKHKIRRFKSRQSIIYIIFNKPGDTMT